MYLSIYIYLYPSTDIYIYIDPSRFFCRSLSLSIYIYMCIYIYILTPQGEGAGAKDSQKSASFLFEAFCSQQQHIFYIEHYCVPFRARAVEPFFQY